MFPQQAFYYIHMQLGFNVLHIFFHHFSGVDLTLIRRNCIDNVWIRDRRQLGSAVAKGERASEYWKAFCFCVVRSGWRWGGRAIGGLGGRDSPKGIDGGGGGRLRTPYSQVFGPPSRLGCGPGDKPWWGCH